MSRWTRERAGWFWGFWGVVGFSLTLPATQVSVPWLGPTVVGFGRATVAAAAATVVLILRREPFPRRELWPLMWVVAGVILGFPWLSAWAIARVPAAHGAVMLGLLPLATAGAGAWRSHERPGARFWSASLLGSVTTVAYAVIEGAGRWQPADAALVAAVLLAAAGYAEGGRLARTLGGWRVISWALLLSFPITVVPTALAAQAVPWAAVPTDAWAGFLYVAFGSQFVAFFAWYHGLALGGVSRVGQVQYLQVFLTLGWSLLWLKEPVTWPSAAAALLVVIAVAWGKGAPVALREHVPSAPEQDALP